MLTEGTAAPQFSVKSDDGKTVSLKDFLGKTIILWFYPKADTPGCTAEGCGFRDRMSQFTKKNAVVLGVSFDTVEENQAFKKKFGFPFPLLCDTERQIGVAYGACKDKTAKNATRIGYIIDPAGKIKRAYSSVDARSFPEQVLGDF